MLFSNRGQKKQSAFQSSVHILDKTTISLIYSNQIHVKHTELKNVSVVSSNVFLFRNDPSLKSGHGAYPNKIR